MREQDDEFVSAIAKVSVEAFAKFLENIQERWPNIESAEEEAMKAKSLILDAIMKELDERPAEQIARILAELLAQQAVKEQVKAVLEHIKKVAKTN